MATSVDYETGTIALASVIVEAIKANVPGWAEGMVAEHQALISQIEAQGSKAVIDAVDAARAKVAT